VPIRAKSTLRENDYAGHRDSESVSSRKQSLLTNLAFATLAAMQRVQFDIVEQMA
jgi:hypothetical protein